MNAKDVVIIGSGCAGYACADRLLQFGIDNIVLMTEGKNMGTSRNTGSDKQTYYKADITCSGDSVLNMARTLYDCGGMDGDKAIVEAVNSLRCFYRLEEYGVGFPCATDGEYVGYKTDHDNSQRATSIGPLTSKRMTEVLEREALAKGLVLLDKALAVRIDVENGKVKGVIYVDLATNALRYLPTHAVVLAVGGSAAVYGEVVYPASQHGALSLAIDAGADTENITEWQYGIASKGFRWNLSGSYQQVVPRYYSLDSEGVEHDFLEDALGDDINECVFLKGYEWPFDSKKVRGSSRVDIAVLGEIAKGRKVYMDFVHNAPSYVESGIWADYLSDAGALGATPYERLMRLNPKAIDIYKAHGIDLATEPIEIAVCAQHCNGGIAVDTNFETRVHGLYVIGEASANFGVYRPGGTALNSTQVGALRSASHIASHYDDICASAIDCGEVALSREIAYFESHIGDMDNVVELNNEYKRRCDIYAGIMRDTDEIEHLVSDIEAVISGDNIKVSGASRIASFYRCVDAMKTRLVVAKAILVASKVYGSRGGAVTMSHGERLVEADTSREYVVVADYNGATCRNRREFTVKEYNFERLLKGDQK